VVLIPTLKTPGTVFRRDKESVIDCSKRKGKGDDENGERKDPDKED